VPSEVADELADEQMLQISINGRPYSLTMRTPGDDRFLVAGLLFSERIIDGSDDLLFYDERVCTESPHRSFGDVHLPEQLAQRAEAAGRSTLAGSSCGLCGKTDSDSLHTPSQPLAHDRKLDIGWLVEMQQVVAEQQQLFQSTGGCHAAAAFTTDGELLCAMEDIGRHNAVDKVVGYLLLNDLLPRADVMSVSGRVSYEIVSKVHAAGIPFLVSVSAPSSLAVDICNQVGITLVSFCRGNRATVYTHNEAVTGRSPVVG
jgi:FdhD protein